MSIMMTALAVHHLNESFTTGSSIGARSAGRLFLGARRGAVGLVASASSFTLIGLWIGTKRMWLRPVMCVLVRNFRVAHRNLRVVTVRLLSLLGRPSSSPECFRVAGVWSHTCFLT